MDIDQLLLEKGFPKSILVTGRYSIADLFRRNRCGIYILHFADDMYYVGQAVDVVRRYSQHCHNHLDIQEISFIPVHKSKLDTEEKSLIRILENTGFRLRNIQLVNFSYGETDFDLIMSRQDQEKWLDDLTFQDMEGNRIVNSHLRNLYANKYQRFKRLPLSDQMIEVARHYVQDCIPAVKRGEVSFWNCSVLPKKFPESQICVRINAGWQTVFDVLAFQQKLFFRWYISRVLAQQVFGMSLAEVDNETEIIISQFEENPQMEAVVSKSDLIKGGQDQVFIDVEGTENAIHLIHDPYMLPAVRLFNLGLMQKSPCPWGKNHCLDLADELVQ